MRQTGGDTISARRCNPQKGAKKAGYAAITFCRFSSILSRNPLVVSQP